MSAVILGSALLFSSPKVEFTRNDKAYYMDEKQAAFVRPGFVVKITKADIAADGTIKVNFSLTDPKGMPLDRAGVVTPGPISVSFIAATIPSGQEQYQAYTTRVQTSPITGKSATQASGQNNGTFTQLGEGEYQYTFSIKAPSNIDRKATHSIGVYGSRNLAEIGLATEYDDDVFHFIPDGGAVTTVRDVIRTETCNKCHQGLGLHGGSRRTVQLCNLCHTPSTFGQANNNIDPDTGNTIDLITMIHKIHQGASLPSVKAGKPYVIVGNAQSVHDYSHINFPDSHVRADSGLTLPNCESCHGQDSAAQKNSWLTDPSRQACGSCHDNINFATGEGHMNLPQVSDSQCRTCHAPQGEMDFDASIKGAHINPRFSSLMPGVVFEIVGVADGAAGKRPTVTFSVKDKSGNPIPANKMDTLRLYFGGPTTDYAAYVQEDARTANCNASGTCTYTFTRAIPEGSKGTFAIYVEGYRNLNLLEGTSKQIAQRDAGYNKIYYFPVDGSKPVARKQVVAMEKCNACHGSLVFHGDQRTTTEGCVVCHNPNETDAVRRPANQMPAQSVDFKTMIHRIHTGEELDHEYTVYGYGNVAHDMTEFSYPGKRAQCDGCHVNNSQQLPLRSGMLPVKDPRQILDPAMPETAACTGCHSSNYAKSHALANTTKLGESCATCHGPSAEYSVDRVHAQ